jgi:hypothetical protein
MTAGRSEGGRGVPHLEGKMLERERAKRGRGCLPCAGVERKREGEGGGGRLRGGGGRGTHVVEGRRGSAWLSAAWRSGGGGWAQATDRGGRWSG